MLNYRSRVTDRRIQAEHRCAPLGDLNQAHASRDVAFHESPAAESLLRNSMRRSGGKPALRSIIEF
jgi:hypothetical protein